MRTFGYTAMAVTLLVAIILLGFASHQFGPLGKVVLIIIVAVMLTSIGLTQTGTRSSQNSIFDQPETEAYKKLSDYAGSNWVDLIASQSQMARFISLEIDRSRRFVRTFTLFVIAPNILRLSEAGVNTSSVTEVSAVRLFIQEVVINQLRTTDIIGNFEDQSTTLALLPETGIDGAVIASERFSAAIAKSELSIGLKNKIKIAISVKAINYPADVTDITGFVETIRELTQLDLN